ncbi:hypothetical protein [Paenibacillus sp. FSL H3-0333]|uniref:hypothetical protein n=1 Tax=Paenibacillus sp. FSL H3-0333 TaxID=2921373 RepID=UPI0030FCE60D
MQRTVPVAAYASGVGALLVPGYCRLTTGLAPALDNQNGMRNDRRLPAQVTATL